MKVKWDGLLGIVTKEELVRDSYILTILSAPKDCPNISGWIRLFNVDKRQIEIVGHV